jgi:ABC-2 type transport system ATP-binding protein
MSDTLEIASNNLDLLRIALNENSQVTEVKSENNILVVKLRDGYKIYDLNSFLISKGIVVTHLAIRKKSLENQFLELLTQSE